MLPKRVFLGRFDLQLPLVSPLAPWAVPRLVRELQRLRLLPLRLRLETPELYERLGAAHQCSRAAPVLPDKWACGGALVWSRSGRRPPPCLRAKGWVLTG
uniref:Uncharacterized protein n=1 Tax=Aegilops tauschii subsp. strangulata TaxID=200361 RepID=A0A453FRL7_AEGTS